MKFEELIIDLDHGEVKKNENYYRIYASSYRYLIKSSIVWGSEFIKINNIKINAEDWNDMLFIYLIELNKTSFFPLDTQDIHDIVEIVSKKTFLSTISQENEEIFH